ncbi:claudin-8-like [Pseudophryne corroboree]|uniref:claudin-8-like n=1 Tax=Pseudophryne corroboree TaxID=495146 RepID=UPI0030819ED3
MVCFLIQILGIISGGIGMILTWIVTLMPQWRLVVLAENNGLVTEGGRIDGEWISRWDGLWVTCVNQMRNSLECNNYISMVSLTTDLKAGRVFMSFGIALTVLAFIFSVIGILLSRCCDEDRRERHCLTLTSGILYLLSAALILIPVIWATTNIVRQAYDASLTRGVVRVQMGEALMLAWPTVVFVLIGGIILCWNCSCKGMGSCCGYKPPHNQEMVYKPCQPDERSSCSPRIQYI